MPRSKPKDGAPIPTFQRGESPRRSRMLTVRITEDQEAVLNGLSEELKIDKAEIARRAIDFWIQNRAKG